MGEYRTAGDTLEAFDASGGFQVDDAEEVEEDSDHQRWNHKPNVDNGNYDYDTQQGQCNLRGKMGRKALK